MIELPGLKLKNPIMPASGTFSLEYGKYFDLSKLGALVMKSCTLEPRFGNDTPRIAECASGMLNSVGLQNPGVDSVITNDLPRYKEVGIPVIASVAGSTVEDYLATAKKLDNLVDALEINISCPNVKTGAMAIGTDPVRAEELTKLLKSEIKTPIYMKLSPNVTDIVEIAKACEAGGTDGLSMINTVTGMRIDLKTGEPILANGQGGLSGPAIKPIGIRAVYLCSKAVNVPIIGMGGIQSANDVKEYLLAGASAVQVGAANFNDPTTLLRLINEL
jgi:dihydroorotate dehydrogenase (NAD+) catalytic subunit